MLTDVTIEGLRGVGKVELKFIPGQRAYTLFGANGVGKTKCLEALYLFLLASNKDFMQSHSVRQDGWLPGHAPVMARMFNAQEEGVFEVSVDANDHFHFRQAWKGQGQPHSLPVVFLGAGKRTRLKDENAPSANMPFGTFEDRREKYFQAIHQAFSSGDLKNSGMSDNTRDWFVKRAQSNNSFQESKDDRGAEIYAVLSMLNEIDSRIDPKSLRIDGAGHVFLKVEEQKRELGELSSGFTALLKMVQALIAGYAAFTNASDEKQLRHVRGIVLIDEIDAHLHPEWQARIVPCLKKLLPNTTFYIATHSPLVLVQLLNAEAYLLKRGDDGVVRSEIIRYPNRRLFIDVLDDATSVDLNKLKRDMTEYDDQTDAKQGLLALLDSLETQEKAEQ